MWTDEYEKLTAYEKGEFRKLGNYLLSHTYMVRYNYDGAEQMTRPDPDYKMAARLYPLLRDYFSFTGWKLEKDDTYGMLSLTNIYDHNRLRVDRFTTLFLYTCRLIYEEGRQHANNFHVVKTDTQAVVEKMRMLGLLEKGKATQKERLDAQRTLAHYNIIQKMERNAWSADGNQLLIQPSILLMVSNEGINDMMLELEELRVDVAGASTAELAVQEDDT